MVEIFPQQISQTAKKAEDIARNILTQDNTFFSQMGMFYLGPIDGHDVETLVKILKNLFLIPGTSNFWNPKAVVKRRRTM